MDAEQYRAELADLTDRALDAGVPPAAIRTGVCVVAVRIAYSRAEEDAPAVGERDRDSRFRIDEELE